MNKLTERWFTRKSDAMKQARFLRRMGLRVRIYRHMQSGTQPGRGIVVSSMFEVRNVDEQKTEV